MKQRTKLFIWIGSLFIFAALISSLVPKYIIKNDLSNIIDTFKSHVNSELSIESKIRKKSFIDILDINNVILNRTLLYLYEDSAIQKELQPTENLATFWKRSNTILASSPEVSFLQLSQENKTYVGIAIDKNVFYSASALLLTNSISLIVLKRENDDVGSPLGPYVGIRFPLTKETQKEGPYLHNPFEISSEDAFSIYYLYPHEDFSLITPEQHVALHDLVPLIQGGVLDASEEKKQKDFLNTLKQVAEKREDDFIEQGITSVQDISAWISKSKDATLAKGGAQDLPDSKDTLETSTHSEGSTNNILRQDHLTNITREYVYYTLSTIETSPFERGVPIGAASFSEIVHDVGLTGLYGSAILNKDIFFDTSNFDAKAYYEQHAPKIGKPSIAKGITLINTKLFQNDVVIGKVMQIPSNLSNNLFLTVGESILPRILSRFATPSSVLLFLDPSGSFRLALDSEGNFLEEAYFKKISFRSLLKQSFGAAQIGSTSYNYFELNDLKQLPLHIIIFSPNTTSSLHYFESLMVNQMKMTGDKLFSQILSLGVLTLGLVLIVLAFLSKKITKPIDMITHAAEEVAQGQYSDLVLPEIENEKDEISILTSSFSRMVSGLQAKEKIRALLDKVVSKEIAEEILKGSVHLGGELKTATILFSDIRGFTHLSENTPPEVVIKHLNNYMTEMSKIVDAEKGVIDKYVGDEIMALYGVPISLPDAADRAITTAILMMDKLKEVNNKRIEDKREPIKIGIGIHTGVVIAGNMGAETRLNYTVLGATVNFASRLCAAAEPMQIRVSKETLEACSIKDSLEIQELPAIIYKGFSNPVVTYSVVPKQKL